MSTFLKLKHAEREVRRELIIDAARDLFSKRPFHEIGMRDIADQAGVSPASIYRYFPSQDDLYVETLNQEITRMEQRFTRRIEENRLSMEELALAVTDYLIDNEATFQMMCHFMISGRVSEEISSKYNAIQRYFLDLFDTALSRSGVKDNVRVLSHAFFASLLGVVMTFRNTPGRTKDDIRRHIHRLARLQASLYQTGIN